ncbi:phage antirepressor [Streptosporangium canum]|uniref:phage antirepressor n=1 Tax=Streptosporangium canum TaxID=324952 RepID=UPI0037BB730A
MSEIELFSFPQTGQQVRTVLIDSEPWFVGRDVAAILAYANTRKAVRDHVPAGHRGGNETFPLADLGLDPQTVLISEAGLYRLIMRSKTAVAEQFQEWVTSEVLPSIRKTGSYAVVSKHEIPQTLAQALRLAANQAEQIEELEAVNRKLTVKAAAFDDWINGKGCYLIGTVAKMLGLGPKRVWDFLYAEKILIQSPGTKRHREPYAGKPSTTWFEVKPVDPDKTNGHATNTTYLLPYGAEQLRLLLIKRGVLPSQQLALIGGVS